VRYCIGADAGGKAPLIKQQQTWNVVTPPPSFSTAGCPNASWGNSTVVADDIVNTAQSPAVPVFSYSPGPLPTDAISAIQADFMVDWNPGKSPSAAELTSGVFLRNQNRAPKAACSAQYAGTGKKVTLNGSASEDPEGFNLKDYFWYADGKPNTDPPDAKGVVALWDAPTSGTHTIRLELKDQGDLPAQATCTAVVP
jgi:hypothetical protein